MPTPTDPAPAAEKPIPINRRSALKSNEVEITPITLDNPEVHSAITKAFERIQSLEAKRKAINDDISAERAGLASRGLNKAAIAAVFSRAKMQESQAEGFGETYVIASKAMQLSLDIQPAMVALEVKKPEAEDPAKPH